MIQMNLMIVLFMMIPSSSNSESSDTNNEKLPTSLIAVKPRHDVQSDLVNDVTSMSIGLD